MRIAVLIAIWQRHDLVRLSMKHLAQQREFLRDFVDLRVCVAGSEGEVTEEIVRSSGALYVETENKPLGSKFNAALKLALSTNPDAVVVLGSDNFVSDSLWLAWNQALEEGYDYAGLIDAFMYSPIHGDVVYWPGYGPPRPNTIARIGEPVGSARMYGRSILKELHGELWGPHLNRSLDYSATMKIKPFITQSLIVEQEMIGVRQIGVKTPDALSGHAGLRRAHAHRIVHFPDSVLSEWFGEVGDELLEGSWMDEKMVAALQ